MSAPQAPASFPFDARPLLQPVSPAAVKAHRDELRRTGRIPPVNIAVVVLTVVIVFFVLSAFGLFAVILIGGLFSALATGDGSFGVLILPLVLVLGALAVGGVLVWTAFSRSRGEHGYRLDLFARANGMQWFPVSANPPLPGMIFSIGSDRKALDVVRGQHPRFVEFGNHRYTTGSGKNQTTYNWGYVAVKLSSPLPHIVLDAKSNNGVFGSNLPVSFHKEQVLSLEGDFDRYFTLYCPREYERDALYLFTPDIMARFIDRAAALDVEIVDDWLFLYARRDFSTTDPQTWAWLFSVVGALLDKLAQWERWRDERLARPVAPAALPAGSAPGSGPAGSDAGAAALPFAAPSASLRPPPAAPRGVAQQGRRLRRGVAWPAIIVFGAVVLFWFLTNSGLLGSLVGLIFR